MSTYALNHNRSAFLNTIAYSEGTIQIPNSDEGYKVLVGSTIEHPLLFDSYADHPRIYNAALNSTAAGKYQLLEHWYDAYKIMLCLNDFSPESQDIIAMRQIYESQAMNDVDNGDIGNALIKVNHIWASLPNSPYGQHENTLDNLVSYYINAGGALDGNS